MPAPAPAKATDPAWRLASVFTLVFAALSLLVFPVIAALSAHLRGVLDDLHAPPHPVAAVLLGIPGPAWVAASASLLLAIGVLQFTLPSPRLLVLLHLLLIVLCTLVGAAFALALVASLANVVQPYPTP